MNPGNRGMTEFMKTDTPDFCWMTCIELFKYVQQEFPDASFGSFKVSLSRLSKEGDLLCRGYPKQYIRPNAGPLPVSKYIKLKVSEPSRSPTQ